MSYKKKCKSVSCKTIPVRTGNKLENKGYTLKLYPGRSLEQTKIQKYLILFSSRYQTFKIAQQETPTCLLFIKLIMFDSTNEALGRKKFRKDTA